MAKITKNNPSTNQGPPLKLESSIASFIDNIRIILEQDWNRSTFTPEQNMYTLEKSCRILTRDYAHQLGLTPIDYDLPRQQWHNTQLTSINQDSTEIDISQ